MSEFTQYQKQMERTFGVPAQFFPAEAPTEELDTSGGYSRPRGAGAGRNGHRR